MIAITARDSAAYQTLAARYMDGLFFFAQRILRNRAEAEDAVQNVFLRIWEAPTRWQAEKGRFKAWLWAITANACCDVLRRSGRILNGASFDLVLETAADLSPQPDRRAEARDQLDHILKLIALLPKRQRAALYLSVYDELTHQEIAKLMKISTDAVESLIARARKNLRQMMKPEQANQNQKEQDQIHAYIY